MPKDMIKLLVIAHNLSPEKNASAVRIIKFLKYLPEHGIEPIVITADKKHKLPHSIKVEVVPSLLLSSPNFYGAENAEKSFMKTVIGKTKVLVKDLLFSPDKEIWWSLKTITAASKLIKTEKIDAIFASGSPFSQFIPLVILKAFLNKPIIIDFRDPWRNHITTNKQSIVRKLSIKFWESKAVKKANAIIAVNSLILKDLNRYRPTGELKVITNGYDQDDFPPANESTEKKEGFIFLYTGKYSIFREDYNPTTIMEGFKLFKKTHQNDCSLTLIGPTDKDTIEFSKQYLNYGINCYEATSRDIICQMQQSADILVHFHYPHTYDNAISLKIYEYLYSGKPILSFNAREGLLYDFIEENQLGVTASSKDVDEIAEYFKLAYGGNLFNNYVKESTNTRKFDYYWLTGELAQIIKIIARRL